VRVKKGDDPLIKTGLHIWIGNHVGKPGEREEVERSAGTEESVGKLQAVTEKDIIVGGTVDQQEGCLKGRSVGDERIPQVNGVTRAWDTEIAFRVTGIVIEPVGDRGTGDGSVEDIRPTKCRESAQVATIRPAHDANPVQVQLWKSGSQSQKGGDLFIQWKVSELIGDRALPGATTSGCATSVGSDHDEALIRKPLIEVASN
jgi:hypothetical protein